VLHFNRMNKTTGHRIKMQKSRRRDRRDRRRESMADTIIGRLSGRPNSAEPAHYGLISGETHAVR
jgi:hypothetical protein